MFTVKQLANLAGVTPRTLRYYDKIGLLKPDYSGENGYRYYAEEALLRLQQILLYREMDLSLESIRNILQRPGFDAQDALERHKEELFRRMARIERLLQTVDDTIQHMKGKKVMNKKQFFEGFSDAQQAEYAQEVEQMYDPATVKASMKKWQSYTAAEKEQIGAEGEAVYADLLGAMGQGPASPAAQAAVERWRKQIAYFWTPADDQLLPLAEGYSSDARFKQKFDRIDPGLAAFIRDAVEVYVHNRTASS